MPKSMTHWNKTCGHMLRALHEAWRRSSHVSSSATRGLCSAKSISMEPTQSRTVPIHKVWRRSGYSMEGCQPHSCFRAISGPQPALHDKCLENSAICLHGSAINNIYIYIYACACVCENMIYIIYIYMYLYYVYDKKWCQTRSGQLVSQAAARSSALLKRWCTGSSQGFPADPAKHLGQMRPIHCSVLAALP